MTPIQQCAAVFAAKAGTAVKTAPPIRRCKVGTRPCLKQQKGSARGPSAFQGAERSR